MLLCSTGRTAPHTCSLHLYSLTFGSPGCPNVRFSDDTLGGPCRNSVSVCWQASVPRPQPGPHMPGLQPGTTAAWAHCDWIWWAPAQLLLLLLN